MSDCNFTFTILYVDSPPASAAFYTKLLGVSPIKVSSTFAMLPLKNGVMLGLWSRQTVELPVKAAEGGGELAFTVVDKEAVEGVFQFWKKQGIVIEQAPVDLDFGRTFVALDLDGHRLRVLAAPAE